MWFSAGIKCQLLSRSMKENFPILQRELFYSWSPGLSIRLLHSMLEINECNIAVEVDLQEYRSTRHSNIWSCYGPTRWTRSFPWTDHKVPIVGFSWYIWLGRMLLHGSLKNGGPASRQMRLIMMSASINCLHKMLWVRSISFKDLLLSSTLLYPGGAPRLMIGTTIKSTVYNLQRAGCLSTVSPLCLWWRS